MRTNYGMRSRQRGAVAVILGITAITLFAFMGIAVDLAYTYSRKTELQNAADAAALSGAKQLNLTRLGAIAATVSTSKYTGTNELVELGYRRGVTYNVFSLNPLGGAVSDPYLLNPVDVPPACSPSHSSAAFTAPFVCNGSSAIVSSSAIS